MPGFVSALSTLRRERIARHGLAQRDCADVVSAVARTTAIQAQDNYAAPLGVRARAAGVTDAAVQSAIADGSVVRTWLMRATIHLVTATDLRWLVALVGPSIVRRHRTRWRQLGLTDELLTRSVDALPDVLAAGPMTRHEIADALAQRGVFVPTEDAYTSTHVLVYASSLALVCRGPDRGRHNTFMLLDDRVPDVSPGPRGDDALAELARRYFAAYSPATAADFGVWSGLAAGRAVELIRDELTPVDVDGRSGFRLGEVEPVRGLRLLPAFDNYLIGYQDRGALITSDAYPEVYQGGMIRPVVLLDGHVAGVWALDRTRGRVSVRAFRPWTKAAMHQVEREVADIGRFLDRDLDVSLAQ